MNGTIYDFRAHPLVMREPPAPPPAPRATPFAALRQVRTGVILNPRAHRNRLAAGGDGPPDTRYASPRTRAELRDVLAGFARDGIDLLVIAGGDGTIRDVLTCAGSFWGKRWPRIAVLPSGKTNALAVDLGVPEHWTLEDAIEAARRGTIVTRSPIEVRRAGDDAEPVRGFLFGVGAFVGATALAQHTHRAGAFKGLAIALALVWGVLQTLFGGAGNRWRRGDRMTLDPAPGTVAMHGTLPVRDARRYILLATTLQRLPVGLRPFGRPRPGLKVLVVDGPPRLLAATMPLIVAGSEAARLSRWGYHRFDAAAMDATLDSEFILDGEIFPAGAYELRRAAPLDFVVP